MNKILIVSFALLLNNLNSEENKINLYELYKELHANPELSYQEIETSNKLAFILKNIAIMGQWTTIYGYADLSENNIVYLNEIADNQHINTYAN